MKRLKKYTLIPLTVALLLAGGCGGEKTEAGAEKTKAPETSYYDSSEEKQVENTYILNEENVKLCGRTYLSSENVLWCCLSGSGAEFDFTGKKLDITLIGDGASLIPYNDTGYARYAVYVDGERTVDEQLDKAEKTVSVIDSESEETHRVRFVKLSECAMSNLGIKPLSCDGSVTPTEPKKLKIEFIGDSITCGYGVDDEVPTHDFMTRTEDCTKAFAFKTAEVLNADMSLFSISGWGIISGYTEGDEPLSSNCIPRFYEDLAFSYHMIKDDVVEFTPQSVDWDFSRFVPDVVVINLGTNDDTYCKGIEERCENYAKEYTNFLTTVHKNNPEAKILCCLGLMGDRLYPYVEKAADEFKEQSGWDEVYTLRLTPQDPAANGYAADYHPTAASHDIAAAELTEKLKEILDL